jgi:hypothetical protein
MSKTPSILIWIQIKFGNVLRLYSISIILIGKHESSAPFFSAFVPDMRNSRILLERRCPVDLQKLVIIYISHGGFQNFNVNLMEELLLIIDFGSCRNKCYKKRKNRCLRSSAYFVNKHS